MPGMIVNGESAMIRASGVNSARLAPTVPTGET